MPRIKILYVIWIIVIVVVVLLTLKYRGEITEFYGIAETREIVVNSESAVVIKKIHVLQGQTVAKGQLLVELENPELTGTINEISNELEEIKAEKASQVNEINYQIKQLQAQYAINRQLTSELKSLEKGTETGKKQGGGNPIKIEIEGLKKALEIAADPLRTDMLESELSLLLERKNSLYICAQVNGVIGSVRCKAGETITPYQPIMTLHTKSPSYIKGFIHEYVYTRITLGQKVKVVSMANPDKSVLGEVEGVGSRIVQYPRRLQRMLNVDVYGREVRIKIPEDNSLLLGEKVVISTYHDKDQMTLGTASEIAFSETPPPDLLAQPAPVAGNGQIKLDIKAGGHLKDSPPIEASGIIYLQDLKHYLIVSDDTAENLPVLHLVDQQGNVKEELLIQGLRKINDMEAITLDDTGNIYVACSQSPNKKGKIPGSRKLLLRLNRDGTLIRLDAKINLFDLLSDAAQKYPQTDWARFITSGGRSVAINIEGIFCYKGDLYLGFKRPFKDGRSVIVKLRDIDAIFRKNILDEQSVEMWKTFDLTDRDSAAITGISDLYLRKNDLYILTYAEITSNGVTKDAGNLWQYDIVSDKLACIKHLNDAKPEGVTFNPETSEFVITCDRDRKFPSQIIKMKLPAHSAGP